MADDMVKAVSRLYRDAYGSDPAVIGRAPGRVEVLGNHTDYNEGYVLSCAIDKEIYVAVGPAAAGGKTEVVSSQYPGMTVSVDLPARQRDAAWANYSLGVLAMLRERGMAAKPVRMAIHGNVPLGAGLSSSAALEVSTALALCHLHGFALTNQDIARACQKAEHEFAGSKCGLLDQFSSIFGKQDHLLFLDFRTLEQRTVPIPDRSLSLVLSISGVSHSLAESAYNDRRHECFEAARHFAAKDARVRTLRDITMQQLLAEQGVLDQLFLKRAKHVVGEDERVLAGVELLNAGRMEEFGRLLFESHESSRVNFENSCPELDVLVDIARQCPGVYGSRLSGGGFGGATLSFVKDGNRQEFEGMVATRYQERTGRKAVVYSAHSADGASVVG